MNKKQTLAPYKQLALATGVAGALGLAVPGAIAGPMYEFTTCGATGYEGPSGAACAAAYSGTTLDGNVSVSGGIQSWTAAAGTYRVTATGAQGNSADPNFEGGRGAQIVGEFEFLVDTMLQIVVGQAGSADSASGGGGGGSFVVDAANNPLLVAGGGGGTRTSVSQNGCDAHTTTFGGTGSGSSSVWGCGQKASDEGFGGSVSSSSWGSAGAGFFGNGDFEYASENAGKSWANGMLGGGGNPIYLAWGGFGGAGSGNGSAGGGGGGGYSGGDGGRLAGGGGSYNIGLHQLAFAGVGFGDGSITIELLSAVEPPPPSAGVPAPGVLGLMVTGLAGVAAMRRRRLRRRE